MYSRTKIVAVAHVMTQMTFGACTSAGILHRMEWTILDGMNRNDRIRSSTPRQLSLLLGVFITLALDDDLSDLRMSCGKSIVNEIFACYIF